MFYVLHALCISLSDSLSVCLFDSIVCMPYAWFSENKHDDDDDDDDDDGSDDLCSFITMTQHGIKRTNTRTQQSVSQSVSTHAQANTH